MLDLDLLQERQRSVRPPVRRRGAGGDRPHAHADAAGQRSSAAGGAARNSSWRLPESGLDQAKRVAVALSRKIAGTVTECESARIQLTTSIGITIAMPGEEDSRPVLARADAALYRAKADGRNCIRVVLADPDEGSTYHAAPPAAPLPRSARSQSSRTAGSLPGPGRRATDFAGAGRPESTDSSGADEARVRAILV